MQVLAFEIRPCEDYGGWDVYLDNTYVVHKPYDGSWKDEVAAELADALGALLDGVNGFQREKPQENEEW